MIVQLSLLIFLLIVTGIGPGMLMTRRMRLAPLERLCTALALSWIAIYLFSTTIYLTGISWHWTYLGSLIALVMFLATLRDTKKMLANHAVRRTLGGLVLLFVWMLLLLALVRNYSGGRWSGDWFEHYDRTQFFLHRDDINTRFIGLYLLPARPPMMNLLAAFFLAQIGKGFPAFELCFATLNLCAFIPATLLLNHLAPRGGRGLRFLIVALLSSPFFVENVTFTWTKLFCAFFVLLAIALYLRKRHVLAFIMMAAACLIHYSTGPFVLYLAANYLWNAARKRWNWRELLAIISLSGALLCSWFGWSIQRYGLHGTLASNTTVTDSSKMNAAENISKIAKNICDSIVPPIFGRIDSRWHQQSMTGLVRDMAFFCYQQNVLFMLGSVGAFVMLWILWRAASTQPVARSDHGRQRAFWFGMIVFCVPLAIATVGEYEPLGLAHAVLQPLALIGIAAVAAYVPQLPRRVRQLLVLGWGIDFLLGVLLQVYLESLTFEVVMVAKKKMLSIPVDLVIIARGNFRIKTMEHVIFIADHCVSFIPIILFVLVIGELLGLCWVLSSGKSGYHGSPNGSRRAVARKLS